MFSVMQEIILLDVSKASPKDAIPPNVIKYIFSSKPINDLNFSVNSVIYPNNMKHADVSPAFKNGDRQYKGNDRPVSILSSLSKIYFITR